MIKFLKDRILPLFMVAWLGGLLPACINDDEDTATGPEKTDGFNISIAISAGEASTARAYDGDFTDKPGVGAENYINIYDLQIYAFSVSTDQDKNNLLLAQVYPPVSGDTVIPPKVTPIGDKYLLRAELPYGVFSKIKDFKLVAVANRGEPTENNKPLAENTLLSDLVKKIYSTNYDGNKAWIPQWGVTGIPMFGVQTVSLEGYSFKVNNQFTPFPLKEVNMLRAMAKIEVGLAENVSGMINSVTLAEKCYNLEGYIAPKTADKITADKITADKIKETDNVTISNIPDPVTAGEGKLSFVQVDNKFVAYVPEFDLGARNTRENKITLVANGKTYYLSLTGYEGGSPKFPETESEDYAYPWNDLVRNHIYRYTITEIKEPAILVELLVEPWEAIPLTPEFE